MNAAPKDDHEHAHLEVHDRHASESSPHGHAVNCPRRGWTPLVECLACQELTELAFDPATNASYVDCTPKKD
ncbi:MAG: hypothetical protein U0359_37140 [Byssovorax sp.]